MLSQCLLLLQFRHSGDFAGICAFVTSLGRRIVRVGCLCILFSDCPVFFLVFRNRIIQTIFVCIVVPGRVVFLCRHLNCFNRSACQTGIHALGPLSQWSCCFSVFSSLVHNHPSIFQSVIKILRLLVLLGSRFRTHSFFSTCNIYVQPSSTVSFFSRLIPKKSAQL